MVLLSCPHCRRQLSVRAENAGKTCKCPHCTRLLRIPAVAAGTSAISQDATIASLPPGHSSAADPAKKAPSRPGPNDATIPSPAEPAALDETLARSAGGPAAVSVNTSAGTLTSVGAKILSDPMSIPEVAGYKIHAVLGRGAMGVVYKATHLRLNRTVALKMIVGGAHAHPEDLVRFLAEAEAIAQLQHPCIVQVYEFGQHQTVLFFTLEYLPGGSLAERMKKKPLTPYEAARMVEQLARAMHHAHQKKIIHRDLKPANVLLTADGAPKITDFGLVKRIDVGTGLTASGEVMGTPAYMAPEQARGHIKKIGPPADIYALGAILYECLTGHPPHQGQSSMDTIMKVMNEEPPPPRRFKPRLHPDLETICMKCLEKEPHQRYASAEQLAEDLRRFQASEPIQGRTTGKLGRLIRWVRRYPAMAGLLAALGAVTLLAAVLLVVIVRSLSTTTPTDNNGEQQAQRQETDKDKKKQKQGDDNTKKKIVEPPPQEKGKDGVWTFQKRLELKRKLEDSDPTKKRIVRDVEVISYYKVHRVRLKKDQVYIIDLMSSSFDTVLRLEDAAGAKLAENDDIDYENKNLNSRIIFTPLRDGVYRLVVTSFEHRKTGPYQLIVDAR